MSVIILDSTILIDLFQGNDIARRFFDDFSNFSSDEYIATTAISYYEIFAGVAHRHSKNEKAFFEQFFSHIDVLAFDCKAAEEASRIMSELVGKGRPVKALDVLIAGIAKANGASKIFSGDRHFESIADVICLEVVIYNPDSKRKI